MFSTLRCGLMAGVVTLTLAAGLPAALTPAAAETAAPADATAQGPGFDDAAAAVTAFRTALAADDFDGVARLLGLDAAKLRADPGTMDTFAKIRAGAAERLEVEEPAANRRILTLGPDLWPLPFPLVQGADGKWAFDTEAGIEEIYNRRIGENELQAIETLRDYVTAQRTYAEADHDGDGVLEYAQKLVSSPGKTDGLYWPEELGLGTSPAAGALDPAGLDQAKDGKGYFGYHFRILTGQGSNVAGGKYDYVINGNMIAGFGLIAWPAVYGETGVHTFVVNQAGIVYERDLGPRTDARVRKITRFDPGPNWDIVAE